MALFPNVSVFPRDATWLSHNVEITSTGVATAYLPFVMRDYPPPVLYVDDFSDPQSGWATGDTGNTRRSYVDGEYEILVRNPGWWAGALSSAVKLPDYLVEAGMRNAAGAGVYGLIFGWVDWDRFYLFAVSPDGRSYTVERHQANGWQVLVPWTYSPAILSGSAVNRLGAQRKGAQITVFVNNILQQTIEDGSYLGQLQTGLYAQAGAQSSATVRFDDFRIEAR
jgi:hypothetical protein